MTDRVKTTRQGHPGPAAIERRAEWERLAAEHVTEESGDITYDDDLRRRWTRPWNHECNTCGLPHRHAMDASRHFALMHQKYATITDFVGSSIDFPRRKPGVEFECPFCQLGLGPHPDTPTAHVYTEGCVVNLDCTGSRLVQFGRKGPTFLTPGIPELLKNRTVKPGAGWFPLGKRPVKGPGLLERGRDGKWRSVGRGTFVFDVDPRDLPLWAPQDVAEPVDSSPLPKPISPPPRHQQLSQHQQGGPHGSPSGLDLLATLAFDHAGPPTSGLARDGGFIGHATPTPAPEPEPQQPQQPQTPVRQPQQQQPRHQQHRPSASSGFASFASAGGPSFASTPRVAPAPGPATTDVRGKGREVVQTSQQPAALLSSGGTPRSLAWMLNASPADASITSDSRSRVPANAPATTGGTTLSRPTGPVRSHAPGPSTAPTELAWQTVTGRKAAGGTRDGSGGAESGQPSAGSSAGTNRPANYHRPPGPPQASASARLMQNRRNALLSDVLDVALEAAEAEPETSGAETAAGPKKFKKRKGRASGSSPPKKKGWGPDDESRGGGGGAGAGTGSHV